MRCDIKNRKEELTFSSKMESMMRYYKQAKQTISQPDFEELSRENRKDLETNFRKAFKDFEVHHLRKLSRMQTSCDRNIELFMADKMKEIMEYISTLLQTDPVQFVQLLFDINEYRDQLEEGINSCMEYISSKKEQEQFQNAGNIFELCYGTEAIVLIRFIHNITKQSDKMSNEKFHWEGDPEKVVRIKVSTEAPPDQEDGDDSDDYDDESSGEEPSVQNQREKTTKATPTTPSATPTKPKKPTKLDKVDEFVNSLEPGPVIISKEDKDIPTTKKPPFEKDTTTQEKKEPTKKPTESEEEIVDGFVNRLEPGIVILKRPTEESGTEASPTLSKEDLVGKIVGSLEPGIVLPKNKGKDKPVKKTDPTPTTKYTTEAHDKLSKPTPVIIDPTEESVETTAEPTEGKH